jgi:uncharacterized protein YndB with AHSA1/START domain
MRNAGACTLTWAVAAPRSEVFRQLADVENLPRWAEGYCGDLTLSRGNWLAYTLNGERFVEVEADERSGVIDIRWADDRGECHFLPLRVVDWPGGRTVVSAVCWSGPWQKGAGTDTEWRAWAEVLGRWCGRFRGADAMADELRNVG